MKCKVCGADVGGRYRQCRHCGTLDRPMKFWRRLNIFGRIADLELQNQKQAAVIMKLWKMVEKERNGKPLPVDESGWCETAEAYIDYVLGR